MSCSWGLELAGLRRRVQNASSTFKAEFEKKSNGFSTSKPENGF